jgi:hypothetical protein
MLETRVPLPGTPRRRRIHFAEIAEHRLDRTVHRVKVHAVDAGQVAFAASARVPCAQPFHKFHDDRVAPHPRWKAPEVAQRLRRARIGVTRGDEATHPKAVRPIGFERDCAKLFLLDEPPGQLSAVT